MRRPLVGLVNDIKLVRYAEINEFCDKEQDKNEKINIVHAVLFFFIMIRAMINIFLQRILYKESIPFFTINPTQDCLLSNKPTQSETVLLAWNHRRNT